MKKKIVVVDDIRNYPFTDEDEGVTLRTSQQALSYLGYKTGIRVEIDELWLDFDLGGDDTAMPVALFLAECAYYGSPYPVKSIIIHSMNPVGSEAMRSVLARYGYDVVCQIAHFHT